MSMLVKNKRELTARMLEAALEFDRAKIMRDGRRLDEHDIWKVCSKIVGDIRNNVDHTLRVNQQTYYRFTTYVDPNTSKSEPLAGKLRGVNVAKMACQNRTREADMLRGAEEVVSEESGAAAMIYVYWECWIRERDQWVAAAWETLSAEQREAVLACIDANEIKAAIKTFEAITKTKAVANNELADAVRYFEAQRMTFTTFFAFAPLSINPPPIQNTRKKTVV